MVGTKGRSSIKQYMPNKPTRWGIKVFARSGASGMYDFFGYTGKVDVPEDKDLGMCANVVIKLTSTLPNYP